jgi:predicted metal-dependent phosphoesterase TrpH
MNQDTVPLRSAPPLVRADLHVHSCHSLRSGNFRFLRSRDCYSRPEDVYRVAKARGMDVVTITDHDSIGGCLEFRDRHPGADDFFVSEEVSCWFPDAPIEVHFGVYGMTEALHAAIQPLRRNVWEVAAALREADVLFSLNHLLHFYRGQIPLASYLQLVESVPALEARNGSMLDEHNALAWEIATTWPGGRRIALAGSDAHTLRRVGRTWTAAPGRTAAEYLASLRAGCGQVGGAHGDAGAVAADAYGVIASYAGSLIGIGPRDHALLRRVLCLLFTIGSAPCQFLPYVIAAGGKRAERRTVARAAREIEVGVRPGSDPGLTPIEAALPPPPGVHVDPAVLEAEA